jgi:hypothetical protein
MWAARLAQYLDDYSFRRRLLNGLPTELRYHLALYEGVTAEDSSVQEIVSAARHLEKTLTSLKTGRRPDGQSALGVPSIAGTPQKSA